MAMGMSLGLVVPMRTSLGLVVAMGTSLGPWGHPWGWWWP